MSYLCFHGNKCVCERLCLSCFCTAPGSIGGREGNPKMSLLLGNNSRWAEPLCTKPNFSKPVFPTCQLGAKTSITTVEAVLWGKTFGTKLFLVFSYFTTLVTLETAKHHISLFIEAKTNSKNKHNFCNPFSKIGAMHRVNMNRVNEQGWLNSQ